MTRTLISKGIKWNSLFTILSALGSIILYILFSIKWSSEEIADFALVQAIIGVVLFLINNSFNYYYVYHKHPDQLLFNEVFNWSFLTGLIASLFLAISSVFYLNYYELKYLIKVFGFAFLVIPIWSVAVIKRAYWQKHILHGKIAQIQILCSVIYYLFSILAVLIGFQIEIIAGIFVFRYLLEALTYWILIKVPYSIKFQFPKSQQAVWFVKDLLVEKTLTFSITQLDILFLGLIVSKGWLGIYELFKRLAFRPLSLLNNVFENLLFAYTSSITVPDRILSIYWRTSRMVLGLVIPIYVGATYFSDWILSNFIGQDFEVYHFEFQLFCIAAIFHLVNNPIDSIMIAQGKLKFWNWLLLGVLCIEYISLYIGSFWELSGIIGGLIFSFILSQIIILIGIVYLKLSGELREIIKVFSAPLFISLASVFMIYYLLPGTPVVLQIVVYVMLTSIGYRFFYQTVFNDYSLIWSFGKRKM